MGDLFFFFWMGIGWQGLDLLLDEALPECLDQPALRLDLLKERPGLARKLVGKN